MRDLNRRVSIAKRRESARARERERERERENLSKSPGALSPPLSAPAEVRNGSGFSVQGSGFMLQDCNGLRFRL